MWLLSIDTLDKLHDMLSIDDVNADVANVTVAPVPTSVVRAAIV